MSTTPQASSLDDWEPLADVREAERRKQEKADQRRLANMSPAERARTARTLTHPHRKPKP